MKVIKTALSFLLGVSSLTSLTGCATIINGTRQAVRIESNPSDATIWLDETYVGKTPKIIEMYRSDNHTVRIELEGYQPYEASFKKELSYWVFGNFIFGGVIGLAIDVVSGGVYKLTPEELEAELSSSQITYTKKSNQACIVVVLKPNPSWQKIGNLVAVN